MKQEIILTKEKLEEAQRALSSTLHKCEKVEEGKKLSTSQTTLLKRRISALQIALSLISKELKKVECDNLFVK